MNLRRFGPVLTAALALWLSGCGGTTTGSASDGCAGPRLLIDDATVRPGGDVQVRGSGLQHGCADSVGMNSDGEVIRQETERPMTGVPLVFTQDEASQVIAHVEPDGEGAVEVTVTIPADASPGEATLSFDTLNTLPVPVEVMVEP